MSSSSRGPFPASRTRAPCGSSSRPVDGGTQFTLTHRGLAERLAAGYGAGWQAHLEGLGTHLDGPEGAPLPWDAGRFDHLLPAYTALAATPQS